MSHLMNAFVSAMNIRERHLTIEPVIGTFPEEKAAFLLSTQLSWGLPAGLTVAALLDAGLVLLYMNRLHPWIGILRVRGTGGDKKSGTLVTRQWQRESIPSRPICWKISNLIWQNS